MNRRNWLALSRKLVDTTDLDYSFNAVQVYMAQNNLAFYGEGVLVTTTYPVPFPVALIGGTMGGTVGNGIAYDTTGYQTRIDNSAGIFTITPNPSGFSRFDLLVLRYKPVGDTLIPEPDLPTSSVYENIHDSYELAVVAGVASSSPVYPTKGQFDIILAGLEVAAGATTSTGVTIDLSKRDIAVPLRAFFPSFLQETPSGAVNGTNHVFSLSQLPYNQQSLLVRIDGLTLPSTEWSLSGQDITLNAAPAIGQGVDAWYVVNSAGSVNPVAGVQEKPTGTVDGTNNRFALAGQPVSQGSTQVFIDGVAVPTEGWALAQNPTQSAIEFQPDYIPQPGQGVYAFYLRNATAYYQAAQGGTGPAPVGGGSGGSSGTLFTEYPQLSSADLSNGYVTLTHPPTTPAMLLLDVIGGGAQAYGSDFTVSSNRLSWAGDLATEVAVADIFRVHYSY